MILPRALLRVVGGPDEGLEQEIPPGNLVIGSGDGCDLVLRDRTVSARHAEISVRPEGYLLQDLGSHNGVLVNGCRVLQCFLSRDISIKLGATSLRVEEVGDSMVIPLSAADNFGEVLGRSAVMRSLFSLLEKLAPQEITVLLEGETGTGKEAIARALHEHGPFACGPFATIDCGAIPSGLMESQLFGHERGAFTGADTTHVGIIERANGGTVFFDEVGELPLELQPKLLRLLEGRSFSRVGGYQPISVRIRVVAATNRNLRQEVQHGRFRQDLYFRLAVASINVPPLRDRLDDLPLLVAHFARLAGFPALLHEEYPGLLSMLQGYRWPGNVRELKNFVNRLTVLPLSRALPSALAPDDKSEEKFLSYERAKNVAQDLFERRYLEDLVHHTGWNVTRAAQIAGLSRRHFHHLLAKHKIARTSGRT